MLDAVGGNETLGFCVGKLTFKNQFAGFLAEEVGEQRCVVDRMGSLVLWMKM